MPTREAAISQSDDTGPELMVRVRRMHRRDINRAWEFIKLVFRKVNRETVEYQRPYSKTRFAEIYDNEGVEQLLFVTDRAGKEHIVGYAECAYEIIGNDNWMNERYFRDRDMRPLYVEELAVHPDYEGRGLGSFVLDQLEHLARVRGCTHLVLEVAENNARALRFYRTRNFQKLDAAVFLAKKVVTDAELLAPRPLKKPREDATPPARARKPVRRTAKVSVMPPLEEADEVDSSAEGSAAPRQER